ncbi:MAG: hypothetical protein RL685_6021 [Pseudomonadota bacterium]
MVGQSVCHYGRSSNSRTCGHEIVAVNGCYNASAPINGTVCALAETDSPSHTLIGGDSGGGWSFGNTAFGVHSSTATDLAVFTPIQQLQTALGVLVTGMP